MKRLPNLARREGNVLTVTLYPEGSAVFTDSDDSVNARSYSLWDYLDGINAVLVYTTTGDATTFTLLQRATNRRFELPTEPQLAPDRQHLVTADICEVQCSNEIAVWRVTRDSVRKELSCLGRRTGAGGWLGRRGFGGWLGRRGFGRWLGRWLGWRGFG